MPDDFAMRLNVMIAPIELFTKLQIEKGDQSLADERPLRRMPAGIPGRHIKNGIPPLVS